MATPLQPVEVEARFRQDGRISPVQLVWEGVRYPILAVGRQWRMADEIHILVMLPGEQMAELVFDLAGVRWWLLQKPGEQALI